MLFRSICGKEEKTTKITVPYTVEVPYPIWMDHQSLGWKVELVCLLALNTRHTENMGACLSEEMASHEFIKWMLVKILLYLTLIIFLPLKDPQDIPHILGCKTDVHSPGDIDGQPECFLPLATVLCDPTQRLFPHLGLQLLCLFSAQGPSSVSYWDLGWGPLTGGGTLKLSSSVPFSLPACLAPSGRSYAPSFPSSFSYSSFSSLSLVLPSPPEVLNGLLKSSLPSPLTPSCALILSSQFQLSPLCE